METRTCARTQAALGDKLSQSASLSPLLISKGFLCPVPGGPTGRQLRTLLPYLVEVLGKHRPSGLLDRCSGAADGLGGELAHAGTLGMPTARGGDPEPALRPAWQVGIAHLACDGASRVLPTALLHWTPRPHPSPPLLPRREVTLLQAPCRPAPSLLAIPASLEGPRGSRQAGRGSEVRPWHERKSTALCSTRVHPAQPQLDALPVLPQLRSSCTWHGCSPRPAGRRAPWGVVLGHRRLQPKQVQVISREGTARYLRGGSSPLPSPLPKTDAQPAKRINAESGARFLALPLGKTHTFLCSAAHRESFPGEMETLPTAHAFRVAATGRSCQMLSASKPPGRAMLGAWPATYEL